MPDPGWFGPARIARLVCNGPGHLIHVGSAKVIAPGSAKVIASYPLHDSRPSVPVHTDVHDDNRAEVVRAGAGVAGERKSARDFSTGREFTVGGLSQWAYILKRRGIDSQAATAPTKLVRVARVGRAAATPTYRCPRRSAV